MIRGAAGVVGCGSNVVDVIHRVRALPMAGAKGYFADNLRPVEATLAGGVTLNHLAWARALGVPAGLMALQGAGPHGEFVRAAMDALGVSREFVFADAAQTTAVSHIYVDDGGERAIMMATGSTASISPAVVRERFAPAVAAAGMVSTEISQLPLDAVEALLDLAAEMGKPSLLDVDVPPSVATTEAGLGDLDTLRRCVEKATVLKPTMGSVPELLELSPLARVAPGALDGAGADEAAQMLLGAFEPRLVAVTDGAAGCALALDDASDTTVVVPAFAGVRQLDATGAGDAFFGGLIAGLHAHGMPGSAPELERLGRIAGAAGAACVEVMGALPVAGESGARIAELSPEAGALLLPPPPAATGPARACSVDASLRADAAALAALAEAGALPAQARAAGDAVLRQLAQGGRVLAVGVGKSGVVARRLAASLSSVGAPAQFVHATELLHGDLGLAGAADVAVLLSHSGGTPELAHVLPMLRARVAAVVAVVGRAESPLGASADVDVVVEAGIGGGEELLGAVPSRSIVAQEAAVNCVLTAVAEGLGASAESFKRDHPGGAIGSS